MQGRINWELGDCLGVGSELNFSEVRMSQVIIRIFLSPNNWARSAGRPRNINEARNKFLRRGLTMEDANGNLQWVHGSQLPTVPPTPSSPAMTYVQHSPAPVNHHPTPYMAANSQDALLNHRDHLDIMQCYREYDRQLLRDEKERTNSELLTHLMGRMGNHRGRNRSWHNRSSAKPYGKRPVTAKPNDNTPPINPKRLTGQQLQDAIDNNRARIDEAHTEMNCRSDKVLAKRLDALEAELAQTKADITKTHMEGDATPGREPDFELHERAKVFTNIIQSVIGPSQSHDAVINTTATTQPNTIITNNPTTVVTNQLSELTMEGIEGHFIPTNEGFPDLPFHSDSEI